MLILPSNSNKNQVYSDEIFVHSHKLDFRNLHIVEHTRTEAHEEEINYSFVFSVPLVVQTDLPFPIYLLVRISVD